MNILHITPHMGGGVGTVIMNFLANDLPENKNTLAVLEWANERAQRFAKEKGITMFEKLIWKPYRLKQLIADADICLIHYWDHRVLTIARWYFRDVLTRVVCWCHKNYDVLEDSRRFPDRFIWTSPIQGEDYIWSSSGPARFELYPDKGDDIVVGYMGTVNYKKVHPDFLDMLQGIIGHVANVKIMIIGEDEIGIPDHPQIVKVGKVDDVYPYLKQCHIFFYPLRPGHYGTCEQVIGEAVCCGAIPVCLNNDAERHIMEELHWPVAGSTEDAVRMVGAISCLPPSLRLNHARWLRWRAMNLYSTWTMILKWNEVFKLAYYDKRTHI